MNRHTPRQRDKHKYGQVRRKRLCPSGTYGAYGTYGTFGAYGTYGTYSTYGTYGTYGTIGQGRGRPMETKLVSNKKLAEKSPVETHERGLGKDDPENKQKVEE